MRSPAGVRTLAFVALLAASVAPIAPARGQSGAPAAPPSFVAGGQLAVCTDPGFAPMEFFHAPGDARPVGFDMDLAAALAARWKAGSRISPTDFKGLLPDSEAGRCGVVISGVLPTPARRERHDAVPYAATHTVLLAARGTDLTRPEDLAGKVLAVEAGTTYEKIAAELNRTLVAAGRPPATVQTYPTPQAITEQVLIGRALAAMTQDVEASYREAQVPGRLRIADTYPEADRFAMFLKRVPGDAEAVRAAVAALKADGTLAQIARRWNPPAGALDVDHGS